MKISKGKSNETPEVTSRRGLDHKKIIHTLCVVGLQRSYLLWIVAAKSDSRIGKPLFPNSSFESKKSRKANKMDESLRYTVFQHNNARPLIAINVRQYLNGYGWNVLCTALYSTDLALSEPFTSLQLSQNCQKCTLLETVIHHIDNFFTNKPNSF